MGISPQPTLAFRIDWSRLEGEPVADTSRLLGAAAVNETRAENFVGEIYGAIFGIWEELNDWNHGLGTDYGNTTTKNSSASFSPDKEALFPPGLEELAYVTPLCLNETMKVVVDYYEDKPYAVKSKFSLDENNARSVLIGDPTRFVHPLKILL